ncbi:MAG: cytochrome b5 domain-containing protein [Candidatus Paceibacterota bacterium]
MKKLSTISLFIFAVVVIAILVAGLVFYQDKKNNQIANYGTGVMVQDTVNQLATSGKSLVLDMTEIAKHNKQTDCWILINGKVYNITSYFGSHPGGNDTMTATCGKNATAAYATKNPSANRSSGSSAHSSSANSMLGNYYLGDLNQTIGQQKIIQTNSIVTPVARGDDDEWDD